MFSVQVPEPTNYSERRPPTCFEKFISSDDAHLYIWETLLSGFFIFTATSALWRAILQRIRPGHAALLQQFIYTFEISVRIGCSSRETLSPTKFRGSSTKQHYFHWVSNLWVSNHFCLAGPNPSLVLSLTPPHFRLICGSEKQSGCCSCWCFLQCSCSSRHVMFLKLRNPLSWLCYSWFHLYSKNRWTFRNTWWGWDGWSARGCWHL